MQHLPTASQAEQDAVTKAAEARYAELGISIDTAATLFQNEITKTAHAVFDPAVKEAQIVESLSSGASNFKGGLGNLWSSLPPIARRSLINALIGGGIGALGGVGYGQLQGGDMRDRALQGAGYGAMAGAATPFLSNLLQKFGSDLDGTFVALVKNATAALVASGFPEPDAEQLLLMHIKKAAAQLDGVTPSPVHPSPLPLPKTLPLPGLPLGTKRKSAKTSPGKEQQATDNTDKDTPSKGKLPIKTSAAGEPDKGDYHTNTVGQYPLQVFASVKEKVNKTSKKRKIKKLASDLTLAVRANRVQSFNSTRK